MREMLIEKRWFLPVIRLFLHHPLHLGLDDELYSHLLYIAIL
jgi:hypothetical protein